jgi:hypothetical protein
VVAWGGERRRRARDEGKSDEKRSDHGVTLHRNHFRRWVAESLKRGCFTAL